MKNTLQFLACLIIYAALGGCSTPLGFGDRMVHDEGIAKTDSVWTKGKDQVTHGEEMVKKGEAMIKDGYEQVRKGEAAQTEGKKLIESGMQLMDKSLRKSEDCQSVPCAQPRP